MDYKVIEFSNASTDKQSLLIEADTFPERGKTFEFYVSPARAELFLKATATLPVIQGKVSREFSDLIAVTGTDEISLSHEPDDFSYAWEGNVFDENGEQTSVQVVLDKENRKITLSSTVYGLLSVSYTYEAYKCALTPQDSNLIIAFDRGEQFDPQTYFIDFSEDDESDSSSTRIQVLDVCTEEPIALAEVYLNDKLVGTTDDDGYLEISDLASGEYSIRIEKDGYLPSNSDNLENDTLIVE